MTEQVVLCWADPGNVSGRFMDSLLRVMYAGQKAVVEGRENHYGIAGHARIESGPRIASARNSLVRQFLDKKSWDGVEWLLMLDADMTFDEDLLDHLFTDVRNDEGKVTRPIVGGLCFGGGHGSILPTMYLITDPEQNNGSPVQLVTDWKDGEIVEVDATGAACLLIHRKVLEHMRTLFEEPYPWFAESVRNGREFGEDWTFMLRCRKQGYPVYVNTAAKIGHIKSIEMNEEMWRTGQSGLKSIAAFGTPEVVEALKLVQPPIASVTPINRAQRRQAERVKR